MRRRRRLTCMLLNAVSLMSLVLCVATIVLWVRSHFVGDRVICRTLDREHRQSDEYELLSDAGSVLFTHITRRFETPQGLQLLLDDIPGIPGWSHSSDRPMRYDPPDSKTLSKLGFYRHSDRASLRAQRVRPVRAFLGMFTFDRTLTAIPYWFVGLLFALPVLPALSRFWGRRVRSRNGLCPACGYDLRATPARCPECGTIFAAQSA